jgi:hypothetical protein
MMTKTIQDHIQAALPKELKADTNYDVYRLDDGSTEYYYSGMTFSRGACARAAHPHFDTSALQNWVEDMGWGAVGGGGVAIVIGWHRSSET